MFVFFCVNVCLLPNEFNYAYPVELGLDQENMIDRKDGQNSEDLWLKEKRNLLR